MIYRRALTRNLSNIFFFPRFKSRGKRTRLYRYKVCAALDLDREYPYCWVWYFGHKTESIETKQCRKYLNLLEIIFASMNFRWRRFVITIRKNAKVVFGFVFLFFFALVFSFESDFFLSFENENYGENTRPSAVYTVAIRTRYKL